MKRQADRVFGAAPQAAAFTAAELLLTGLLAMALARLVWTVVTPVGPLGDWQPAGAARAAADTTVLGRFDPFFRQGDGGVEAVSSIGLTLVGTRVDTVSGRGSAIIATQDGVQSSYLVGEDVLPGVRLQAVAFDSVTLDSNGRSESLFLDQSSGAPPITPETAGMLAQPTPAPRLAADIQVTPRLKGTAITGYLLAPKGSGAAFAAAGLQAGDVLVTVDGGPVAAVRDPATLVQRLDAGGAVIGVERGGRLINLRIGGQ
ncbi:MAG: type II secretion system protein N [Polymorphobacter sp.]